MKESKNNFINGNTVLAPNYNPARPLQDEEYEKLKKSKKESLHNIRQKRLKSKKNTLMTIALVCIVGVTMISRYSAVYSVQRQLAKVKANITTLDSQNESLKITLLKNSNIQQIEDSAVNKLHMVQPDKSQIIYADLTKDNFAKEIKDDKKNSQQNLFMRIKNMLF